jgi:hypothetical protein
MAPKIRFTPEMLTPYLHLTISEQAAALGCSPETVSKLRSRNPDHVKWQRPLHSWRRAYFPEMLTPHLDKSVKEQAAILGCSITRIKSLREEHPHYADKVARARFMTAVRNAYPDMDAIVRLAQQHATQKEN